MFIDNFDDSLRSPYYQITSQNEKQVTASYEQKENGLQLLTRKLKHEFRNDRMLYKKAPLLHLILERVQQPGCDFNVTQVHP